MEYKGYLAKIDYSEEDNLIIGKIASISDSVNFHCENTQEIQGLFKKSVDDYLTFCKENNLFPNFPLNKVPEPEKIALYLRLLDESLNYKYELDNLKQEYLLTIIALTGAKFGSYIFNSARLRISANKTFMIEDMNNFGLNGIEDTIKINWLHNKTINTNRPINEKI